MHTLPTRLVHDRFIACASPTRNPSVGLRLQLPHRESLLWPARSRWCQTLHALRVHTTVHVVRIVRACTKNCKRASQRQHFGAKSSLAGSLHDIKQNYAKAVASCLSLTIFKLELGQEVTLVVTEDSILWLILGVTQQCGQAETQKQKQKSASPSAPNNSELWIKLNFSHASFISIEWKG